MNVREDARFRLKRVFQLKSRYSETSGTLKFMQDTPFQQSCLVLELFKISAERFI